MKTKPNGRTPSPLPPPGPHRMWLTDEEWRETLAAFTRKTKAQKKAFFVKCGILNPDGTLHKLPMDHVPLGPRE